MNNSELKTEFDNMRCMPMFELEIVNNEGGPDYLIVNLSCDDKGIYFSFDTDNKPVFFDGEIEEVGASYLLPWDDCFSLDEHLQTIDENLTEGFILPNHIYR